MATSDSPLDLGDALDTHAIGLLAVRDESCFLQSTVLVPFGSLKQKEDWDTCDMTSRITSAVCRLGPRAAQQAVLGLLSVGDPQRVLATHTLA